jgi:hypothetical protein
MRLGRFHFSWFLVQNDPFAVRLTLGEGNRRRGRQLNRVLHQILANRSVSILLWRAASLFAKIKLRPVPVTFVSQRYDYQSCLSA